MKKKSEIQVKPWCPFCGLDVGRATAAAQRKLNEFPVGRCDCGAIYVCDATGHNVGAAMVEGLVHACNDNWELAWDLTPEEDYLTGRIENYDEQTHQVVESRNLNGRAVRGVLFFVRLHKDFGGLVAGGRERRPLAADRPGDGNLPPLEPERDAKRLRRKADKRLVKELAAATDIDQLVDLAFDDRKTLRFLQRLLYDPSAENRYHTAWVLGQVCARVSTREPGQVADLLHRLFEACSDSASTSWGMVEAIGAIVAARPDVYGAFTRHLLNYLKDPETREGVLWALGQIAATRPDLIRTLPFYSLFKFLEDENPRLRGLTIRLLTRIAAGEALFQIMGLQHDQAEIIIFEQGQPLRVTISALVAQAVTAIHGMVQGEAKSE